MRDHNRSFRQTSGRTRVALPARASYEESVGNMNNASAKKLDEDLRPRYDLSQLKTGVRGKYYRRATRRAPARLPPAPL